MVEAAHALHGDEPSVGFDKAALKILETNIILGDSLKEATELKFIEYKPINGQKFERTPFFLEEPEMDLFFEPPMPLETVHYLELGRK
jgi:hypothetical protein